MSLDWLMPKKPRAPVPPPTAPTQAMAESSTAPTTQSQSLVSTGSLSGLKKKATTRKRSLIGSY